LPGVLFGCATCAVTFREKRKFKIFENGVLGKILVPRRKDVTGENYMLGSFTVYTPHQIGPIGRLIKSRREYR